MLLPTLSPLARWGADILARLFVRLKAKADRNVGAPKKVTCALRPAADPAAVGVFMGQA
jgi:hypothetical protein